jgi:4-amino-4-deoxy-L-arabinose transferase-like glycosyltransferase
MDSWSRLPWIGGIVLVLVLVVPWYVAAEMRTPGFLRYFIIGEHFERFLVPNWNGDLYGSSRTLPFGTIFLFVFVGALPWSGILIGLLFRKEARRSLFSRALVNDPWVSYLIYWVVAPLLLFTFARNILMTYAATSVPALVLLTAHALWRGNRPLDRGAFVTAALAIPVLIIGVVAVSLIKPGIRQLPTQANIVATVKKMDGAEKLVYVFDRPYSASFYSHGTALLAHDNAQAKEFYDAGAKYFVVAQRAYARLTPDMQSRVERVAAENNTLLLRRR